MKVWIVYVRPVGLSRYIDSIWSKQTNAQERINYLKRAVQGSDYIILGLEATVEDAVLKGESKV